MVKKLDRKKKLLEEKMKSFEDQKRHVEGNSEFIE